MIISIGPILIISSPQRHDLDLHKHRRHLHLHRYFSREVIKCFNYFSLRNVLIDFCFYILLRSSSWVCLVIILSILTLSDCFIVYKLVMCRKKNRGKKHFDGVAVAPLVNFILLMWVTVSQLKKISPLPSKVSLN